jgi:O-antigen/teichoic acid export membrane protein
MISKLKSLINQPGFMKYFKNTSWLVAEKIFRMAVLLFTGIWIARYLGPNKFGLLSYVKSFVGLFTAISTLGLNGIVVRELVKDKTQRDKIIGTAFWLKLMGAFSVLSILAFAINFMANDTHTNILVFIIASSTIFHSFNVIDFYFQSKVLSKYIVYANIVSLFISSIVKITLIINDAPLIAFAWVVLFDSVVLAVGFLYVFLKNSKFRIQNLIFNKETAISLLKDSWPLILSGLVISIYMKIDQVMIKEILGNDAVGYYGAAVRISSVWYFIPMAIANSLFPAIINAKKISKKLYHKRLQQLYDLMVWMAIAIALPMTFMSNWLVKILYGQQYSQASDVLKIHIWTGVFVFLGVAFSKYLTNENLTKKSFYRTLLGAIINVILNLMLIPQYGISGAAFATLIGQFTANYIYDVFDKDLYDQLKMKTKCFFPIHILKGYK